MDRRELLKMIAVVTGGAVIGSEFLLESCKSPVATSASSLFTEKDIDFLNEVAETILPATQTPGAKAADVGRFMTVAVNDCYTESNQNAFVAGMKKLKDTCEKRFHTSFMKATPEQRKELLIFLDQVGKEYQKMKNDIDKAQGEKEKEEFAKGNTSFKKEEIPPYYFTMMKQLTLWGYFTSEIGMTKALRYVPVPGRYDGCIDYKKGEKIMVGLMG